MIGPQRLPCETPGTRLPAPRAAPPARAADTRWILPATIIGSSLGFIDGSVVNVALPAMQHGLQAQLATIQWVVNGYMLTLAGLILLGGALFLLPFVLINLRAYSAAAAGAVLLPFPLLMGALSRAAGGLVGRFGARPPLIVGPLAAACGYAWLGLSVHFQHYWSAFLPGLVLIGIGMTIAVAPLTATIFESTPRDQSGVASGINNAAARAGGLIAVAALGLAFGSFDTSSGATAAPGASALPGISALAASALLGAYRLVMFAAAALAVLGAGTAAATISRKQS